jgi:hypothetical protein
MRKQSKNILLALALLSVVSACNKQAPEAASSSFTPEVESLLVNHGVSEYVIVLPKEATTKESFAASELQEMLFKSSGATLPIVSEDEVKANDCYISLGQTTQLSASGIDTSNAANLETSGYLLKSKGANLYIVSNPSGDGEGTLYGVYDFLHQSVGYEAYSYDEISCKSLTDVPLYAFDETYKPSFDTRSIGYLSLAQNPTYLKRMKLINQYNDERWGLYGHSMCSSLLNVEDTANNRAWYTGTTLATAQLEYTYGEELETAMANALIGFFKKYPKASYFQLGQEDNHNFSTSDAAKKAESEWGMNMAGLQIAFVNNVIAKCEKWLDENEKGREIHYVVYAYYETFDPPVKKDASGAYVPFSEKVIPNEKLDVFFTPIWTNYGETFSSSENLSTKEALEGWSALAKGHLYTYMYDTNFHNYMVNFHNILTAKSMYDVYQQNGVNYLYTQGPLDSVTPGLEQLRIYVESSLLWDLSKDYESLVKDFMAHYFDDAKDDLYEYYDLTMSVLSHQQALDTGLGNIYSSIGSADIWTEPIVSKLDGLLQKALSDIAYLEDANPTRYETLKKRIMKEYLTVLYLELSYYQAYYSESEVAEKKKLFKTYAALWGVIHSSENVSLGGIAD